MKDYEKKNYSMYLLFNNNIDGLRVRNLEKIK